MGKAYSAEELVRHVATASSIEDLRHALILASAALGFRYFALTHHVDLARASGRAIRLHNYPTDWADYYDRHALAIRDPVHRASHRTSIGFAWSDLATMINLTDADRAIVAMGREQGVAEGFTIPAHVPGEPLGSCSFASHADVPLDRSALPATQLVGMMAFETARRLFFDRRIDRPQPHLTDRERDCLMWVARGKSDWEIARILGISEETVDRHLKNARERYDLPKRTSVVVRALFDGSLSFSEIVER